MERNGTSHQELLGGGGAVAENGMSSGHVEPDLHCQPTIGLTWDFLWMQVMWVWTTPAMVYLLSIISEFKKAQVHMASCMMICMLTYQVQYAPA